MTTPDPYDAHLAAIRDHVETLAVKLARWQLRQPDTPRADQRHAANDAIDAIDAIIGELYQIRGRLTGEMRAADDATDKRVDEMLRRLRGEGGQ